MKYAYPPPLHRVDAAWNRFNGVEIESEASLPRLRRIELLSARCILRYLACHLIVGILGIRINIQLYQKGPDLRSFLLWSGRGGLVLRLCLLTKDLFVSFFIL